MSRYSFSLVGCDASRAGSRAQELRDYLAAQGESIVWEGESTEDYAQFDCIFLFAYEDDTPAVEALAKHFEGQLQRPRVIVMFDEVFNCSLTEAWRSIIEPEMEIGEEHALEASLSFLFEEVPDAGTHSNVGSPMVFDVSGDAGVMLDDEASDEIPSPDGEIEKTEADFLLGDLKVSEPETSSGGTLDSEGTPEVAGVSLELSESEAQNDAATDLLSADLEASLRALEGASTDDLSVSEEAEAESSFQSEPESSFGAELLGDAESVDGLNFQASEDAGGGLSLSDDANNDGALDLGADESGDGELSLGGNEEVSLSFSVDESNEEDLVDEQDVPSFDLSEGQEEAQVADFESGSWGQPVAEASEMDLSIDGDPDESASAELSFESSEESQVQSSSDESSSVFLGALDEGPASEEASRVQEAPLGDSSMLGSDGLPRILSGSEEVATVQKYAALKERESREKEATIQVLKGQMVKLDAKLQKSEKARRQATIECDELKNQVGTLEEELSQKNYYIQKSEGAHQEEIKAINMRLDNAVFQANKAQNKYEDFRDRVRSDFVKIRAQERELYNKLELQKRDAEALLASKDEHLLTLRRQVDQLQYELEGLRERWIDETEKSEDRAARLNRSLQSLKMAHDMLSGLNEEVLPSAGDKDLTENLASKKSDDEGEAA